MQTIGISNYDLATSGFNPLPSSVPGAKAVENFFLTEKGKPSAAYKDVRVWDGLYDDNATKEQIRKRLRDIAKEAKEEDVVFLFFSGHGIVLPGQEMFYFVPFDMRGKKPRDQRETGLNTAMLAQAIRETPARRIVLVIDACQSGGAIESLARIADVKLKSQQNRGLSESRVGAYVIAAATPLQVAVQPKSGNGALVITLLEALQPRDGPAGDTVWIRQVIKHIEQRLPIVSAAIGQSHTPMTVYAGVDFPIAKK
jgi:uncharacterized caspase-like protein